MAGPARTVRKGASRTDTMTGTVARASSTGARATRTPEKTPRSKTRVCARSSFFSSYHSPVFTSREAWATTFCFGTAAVPATKTRPKR